ncbi:NB-ARC domain-containing protein [Amycolatopsis xylanica]|uniref:NB-ARC domain-containing protein n=1 Tax=Amycolatopsis xylanica TaxID=589385 RepID=A0A1H2SLQ4_9PSEU|nr:tetratricopeptide repeat protein [Amycolatopsis xylanica]SDW32541.1 NB-ARC domain-containing protein [Amycolatopsis xylanica]
MAGGFGELLRQLRRAAGMTQQQLAESSGVSVRSISRLEAGQRTNPRLDTVRGLADALGLEPDARRGLLAAAGGDTAVAADPGPPAQLPVRSAMFVGRRDELTRLDRTFHAAGPGGTVVVSAIGGGGGFGKTWLAVRWAHDNAYRFPDGQLFVDLRGYSPTGQPMPPEEAIRGFLDALGVPPAAIPIGLPAQTALYREVMAGRRMLVVLDNARDTDQVLPLLPGGDTHAVIATSRDRLAGLITGHGATPLPLDALDDTDAWQLLARRLGSDRLRAEPGAVTELLARCAGLPLALAVTAARAALRPDVPLAELAGELRDSGARLGALDTGDPAASVRAALSWTHDALTPAQAEAFALLGLAPGPDISLPAAASVTHLSDEQAGEVLRALERVSLIQRHAPGRYRMHDLVKLFAADQARHGLPVPVREAALRRLADFYLHTAFAGGRLLDPHRQPIELGIPAAGCHPHPLPDRAAALEWFEAEHPNLLATQRLATEHHWDRQAWQIAWGLNDFLWQQGHSRDFLAVWSAALTSAERLADPLARSLAHRGLGRVHSLLGHHDEGLDHLRRALAVAQDAGDQHGQGHAHRYLAWVCDRQGNCRQALQHESAALELFRALDLPAWQGDVLNMMGWSAALNGDHDQAREHCEAALALLQRHDFPLGVVATLDSLGYIARQTGRHADAFDYYQRAHSLCRDLGHTNFEAEILDGLAHAHLALGRPEQARTAWRQALGMFQAQHRATDADLVTRRLATLQD